MCFVAFRKIFFDVWLCSWKYHRKHIFYLLLTFSHIFSVTKWIHNIIYSSKHKKTHKKIIKSGQTKARSRSWSRSKSARSRWARSRSRSKPIGVVPMITIAIDADRSLSLALSVFCSRGFLLSVALSLFYAYYEKCLKVKRFCKMISGLTSANFG